MRVIHAVDHVRDVCRACYFVRRRQAPLRQLGRHLVGAVETLAIRTQVLVIVCLVGTFETCLGEVVDGGGHDVFDPGGLEVPLQLLLGLHLGKGRRMMNIIGK